VLQQDLILELQLLGPVLGLGLGISNFPEGFGWPSVKRQALIGGKKFIVGQASAFGETYLQR